MGEVIRIAAIGAMGLGLFLAVLAFVILLGKVIADLMLADW